MTRVHMMRFTRHYKIGYLSTETDDQAYDVILFQIH